MIGKALEPGAKVWGHGLNRDEESWSGAYETREEAIEDGRDTYEDEAFHVKSGTVPDTGEWLYDVAEDFVDRLGERAYEEVGELAEDWPPTPSKEAANELQEFCAAWVRKHMPPTFWAADGEVERVEASPLHGESQVHDAGSEKGERR